MKRVLALIAAAFCLATSTRAQSMGTLTENGVSMDVKATVVLSDPESAVVLFYLLPFQPTAEEIAKLQANDQIWLLSKPTPDAKKWKQCPFGKFQLDWGFHKDAMGDAKKAAVFVYSYSVGVPGSNLNVTKFGDHIDVAFAGAVKVGQDVTATSKGSETLGQSTLAWDLKLKGKILTRKKE